MGDTPGSEFTEAFTIPKVTTTLTLHFLFCFDDSSSCLLINDKDYMLRLQIIIKYFFLSLLQYMFAIQHAKGNGTILYLNSIK